MRNKLIVVLSAAALYSAAFAFSPDIAGAEVNINIGIGAPLPPIIVAEPREVVLIPGSYVYFVPGIGHEVFFYSGNWYRRHKGGWYRSASYNGSWVYLSPSRVPAVLVRLPRDYHRHIDDYEHIPYGRMKKHWKEKEKEHRKHENKYREHKHTHRSHNY